ncbi:jg11280, partial [Pararge aegeria aegeria]
EDDVRQETRNMLFGQTNNPYHTGRTSGGSSGGEAALCAALASPISLCE